MFQSEPVSGASDFAQPYARAQTLCVASGLGYHMVCLKERSGTSLKSLSATSLHRVQTLHVRHGSSMAAIAKITCRVQS